MPKIIVDGILIEALVFLGWAPENQRSYLRPEVSCSKIGRACLYFQQDYLHFGHKLNFNWSMYDTIEIKNFGKYV